MNKSTVPIKEYRYALRYHVLSLLLAIKYIEYRLSLLIIIGLQSLMVVVDLFVGLSGIN